MLSKVNFMNLGCISAELFLTTIKLAVLREVLPLPAAAAV